MFQSTHWSYLVHVVLGVVQWQAKRSQIQIGPRFGPVVESAVGPCRSWLLSGGCPRRKECVAGYTGVVCTAHHSTAVHVVDWQSGRQQTQAHNVQQEVHRTWERPDVCY